MGHTSEFSSGAADAEPARALVCPSCGDRCGLLIATIIRARAAREVRLTDAVLVAQRDRRRRLRDRLGPPAPR